MFSSLQPEMFSFSVPLQHPLLAAHFPGEPVVPGAMLCVCLCRHFTALRGSGCYSVGKIKFLAPVYPDTKVSVRCENLSENRWSFVAQADDIEVARGQFNAN